MRRGELLSLRWRGVDLDRQMVSIAAEDSKNHRRRSIPMTADLYGALAKLAISRPASLRGPDCLVFAHDDGRPLSPSTVTHRLRAAVSTCDEIREEKKPKVTMHTLRHTAASLMVQGGPPIFDVAKILGHQDVKTTMRYAHFAPEAGRDTIDTLGQMLGLGRDDDDDSVHDGEDLYEVG